ncbi:hypothetical protein NIES2098_65160 [Calothrix sp. NIES-2098]|nr:hypothetical protein NIES2098_65160 [Calothrix sp. NIES-2098]
MYIERSSLLFETLQCQPMDKEDLSQEQSRHGEWLNQGANNECIAVFGLFARQG